MKRLSLCSALILCWLGFAIINAPLPACAQAFPMIESDLSLTVAHSDYGAGDRLTPVGFHFSAFYNVHRYIRLGGEFSSEYKTLDTVLLGKNLKLRDYQLFAGPELVWRNRSRVTPFAHVLGGFATRHFNIGNGRYYCDYYSFSCSEDEDTLVHDSGYGFAFGGGVDVQVHPLISVRAFQFDYVRTHYSRDNAAILAGLIPDLQSWQKSYRFTVGVVLRLGEKGVK